ncbi:MAG: 3'(2'),5'-bisphosphate nucleotidase CysQ [Gammaproteobacteria bacterium]
MNLELHDLERLCEVAIDAARQSGAMIQSFVGRDFTVDDKTAGSSPASQIVSEVDFKSQDVILELINPTMTAFDLGLLIEESEDDHSRFEKNYFWCIDPLDGTLSFVEQQPGYAVSIALVSRTGTPVIGVVYDPLTDALYHAVRNAGAFRNLEPWALEAEFSGRYEAVHNTGAVLNACWVLEQAPAYFMKKPKLKEGGGCLWDYAATACLFEEIGGFACDSHGNSLDLNSRDSLYMNRKGVLFASHKEIIDEVCLK